MDYSELITAGMINEKTFMVTENHSAIQAGSGGVPVLATPWMIAFMENVSFNLLEEKLSAGYSSVGVLVNVRHLAPTPIDKEVRVQSEVTLVEGKRVTFTLRAWDESVQIGKGTHQRVIIDKTRFLKRVG